MLSISRELSRNEPKSFEVVPKGRGETARCCSIGGPPLSETSIHPGGPRGSTYSRMSGPSPEQVDPHLVGYGSLARGPDGWSAGPVTFLGRARVRARAKG